MIVNKAKVKFQSGAAYNLLPLKDYARAMGDPDELYLQKSTAKLTMYSTMERSCTQWESAK